MATMAGAVYLGVNGQPWLGGILGTNVMIGGTGNDEFLARAADQNPGTDFNDAEDTLTIRLKKEATDPAV